jgi:putative membrane protein
MRHLGRIFFAGLTAMAIIITPTAGVSASSNGSGGSDSSKVCGLDKVWLKMSIEGDRFEIKGGQIALKHSSSVSVRKLARTLIEDHKKSLQEAISLAKKVGAEIPKEPSPAQQWILEEISEMWGREFNHDYSEIEVKDHVQDIDEAKDEVKLGCNWDVRADAKKEIPVLQMHLALAQNALKHNPTEH